MLTKRASIKKSINDKNVKKKNENEGNVNEKKGDDQKRVKKKKRVKRNVKRGGGPLFPLPQMKASSSLPKY